MVMALPPAWHTLAISLIPLLLPSFPTYCRDKLAVTEETGPSVSGNLGRRIRGVEDGKVQRAYSSNILVGTP